MSRSIAAGRLSNREIKRRALRATEVGRMALEAGQRASLILLTALHASGGAIVVTEQQITDVGNSAEGLDYSISDGLEKGTSVISLVGTVKPRALEIPTHD